MDDKQVHLPTEIDTPASVSLSASSPLTPALDVLTRAVDALVDAQTVALTAHHDTDEMLVPAIDDVRRAIQRVCTNAHVRHLKVEQVIVLVKQACGASLAGTARRRKSDRGTTLNAIITAFITEFYTPTAEKAVAVANPSGERTPSQSSRHPT